jgi:hypothetical protein
MNRQFSGYVTDVAKVNLATLADSSTNPKDYANALYSLGTELGSVLLKQFTAENNKNICIACTVEDADYLAKGIIDRLSEASLTVSLACFWNDRHATLPIAPIIRKYREPDVNNADILVIVKSIISSACVVKTNLTFLIQDIEPRSIFVVAPVIHTEARENLECEFPQSISEKFEYIYFAEDEEKQSDGILVPGIGGSIYERLGFKDQAEKNQFTPQLVKDRRVLVQL